VATMATLTVRSGSEAFGRIRENPCKLAVSANGRHRARTLAHIAPRRSPVRVRLAPSKALEIGKVPEKLTPPPGPERGSQAVVKYLVVYASGTGCGGGRSGVALASSTDRTAPSGVFVEPDGSDLRFLDRWLT
jgi:hypothetical protein